MAGRVTIINMLPLSFREVKDKKEEPFTFDIMELEKRASELDVKDEEIQEKLIKGFYPELYDNTNLKVGKFYAVYISTYIERDVRSMINIKDYYKFKNFMQVIASLTGQEINYSSIGKAVGVDHKTIQTWLGILEAGNIIHFLQPYNEQSMVKRVVKRPKLYFWDVGLASHLLGYNDVSTLINGPFYGRLLETYIINEILKSYINNGISIQRYYYRDTRQNEVDLLLLQNGTLNMVECKSGKTYKKSDVSAFKELDDSMYEVGLSCVVCLTDKLYSIDKNIAVVPATSI